MEVIMFIPRVEAHIDNYHTKQRKTIETSKGGHKTNNCGGCDNYPSNINCLHMYRRHLDISHHVYHISN